jgi:hypothetical protein
VPKVWTDAQKLAPGDAAVQAFTDAGGVFLPLAYSLLNSTNWGSGGNNQLDTAAMYLALHLFTVGNKTEGAAGPISNEKVGDVARARDILQQNAWESTPYGKLFRLLMNTLPDRIGLVSGSGRLFFPTPYSFFP